MTLLNKETLRSYRKDGRQRTKTLIKVFIFSMLTLFIGALLNITGPKPSSAYDENIYDNPVLIDSDSLLKPLSPIPRSHVTNHGPFTNSELSTATYQNRDIIVREKQNADLILSGKVHLIEIRINPELLRDKSGYQGVRGVFCPLDWPYYKRDPPATPMFRFLTSHSCNRTNIFTYDLRKIVEQAKAMDNDPDAMGVHSMKPSGFIFHESRCGSTLVANILTVMEPTEHRIYSESGPPIVAAQACGLDGKLCPPGRSAELLRDVVYLMGRTGDPNERKLFFKMQSMASKYVAVVTEAFPDVPWIFVYRDPIQIMMSQLKRRISNANCVRHWNRSVKPKGAYDFLASIGREAAGLSPVERCALHLSTLCDAAIAAIGRSGGMGIGVRYENLVDRLITDVIPNHFKVPVNEERRKRIVEISSRYSKDPSHSGREWDEDSASEGKKQNPSPEIIEASKVFLYPSYNMLKE